MPDMDRAAINRMVVAKLADPEFRRRLSATAPDGVRPIFACLRTDPMCDVVSQVATVGGAANIVVPWLNGILVFTLTAERRTSRTKAGPERPHLGDCTLGVFLERVRLDGDADTATYAFTFDAPSGRGGAKQARAELVAMAG